VEKYFLFFIYVLSSWASANDCYLCLRPFPLTPKVPESPIQLVDIEKIDYPRNEQANYCKRPVEMIDTIVLHHSASSPTTPPERINDYHLERENNSWLMIGYSFVINSPYPGSIINTHRVAEGRPLDIVGAHASEGTVEMDAEQQTLWDEGKITCGNDSTGFKVGSHLVINKKIKVNVTSIGVLVAGNYSPFSKKNPGGYTGNDPVYPSAETLDLTARTACQLQYKYPRIKNIKWHSFYSGSLCPGTIKDTVDQIKTLARKYGCEFN
jgi:hypothetical protein